MNAAHWHLMLNHIPVVGSLIAVALFISAKHIRSFSAHADQEDLVWFARNLDPRPRKIFLVHGDETNRMDLAQLLKAQGLDRVELPRHGQSFDLN